MQRIPDGAPGILPVLRVGPAKPTLRTCLAQRPTQPPPYFRHAPWTPPGTPSPPIAAHRSPSVCRGLARLRRPHVPCMPSAQDWTSPSTAAYAAARPRSQRQRLAASSRWGAGCPTSQEEARQHLAPVPASRGPEIARGLRSRARFGGLGLLWTVGAGITAGPAEPTYTSSRAAGGACVRGFTCLGARPPSRQCPKRKRGEARSG